MELLFTGDKVGESNAGFKIWVVQGLSVPLNI